MNTVKLETILFKGVNQDLNPYMMVMMRFLNLTILRWRPILIGLGKELVKWLIIGRKPKQFGVIKRCFLFGKNSITVTDKICCKADIIEAYKLKALTFSTWHLPDILSLEQKIVTNVSQ